MMCACRAYRYPHAHSHFPYAIPVPTMGRMYNLCITYAQHADPVGNYVQNLWITLGTGGRWGIAGLLLYPPVYKIVGNWD